MKRPVRVAFMSGTRNWYLKFKVIKGYSFDSSYQIKNDNYCYCKGLINYLR